MDGVFYCCIAARGGYDLQGSQYFLPELRTEFYGGRVVWNIPRFKGLPSLLWCGKCNMGSGRNISEREIRRKRFRECYEK